MFALCSWSGAAWEEGQRKRSRCGLELRKPGRGKGEGLLQGAFRPPIGYAPLEVCGVGCGLVGFSSIKRHGYHQACGLWKEMTPLGGAEVGWDHCKKDSEERKQERGMLGERVARDSATISPVLSSPAALNLSKGTPPSGGRNLLSTWKPLGR